MPIKKSGFILLMCVCSSTGLLVFTSYQNNIINKGPVKKVPLKCSQQCGGAKYSSPWNIVSFTMVPLEG